MNKFKIGQKVRCIKNRDYNIESGCGWKEGYVFTIEKISTTLEGKHIYWYAWNNNGVYENFLELADKPKIKEIKPYEIVNWLNNLEKGRKK